MFGFGASTQRARSPKRPPAQAVIEPGRPRADLLAQRDQPVGDGQVGAVVVELRGRLDRRQVRGRRPRPAPRPGSWQSNSSRQVQYVGGSISICAVVDGRDRVARPGASHLVGLGGHVAGDLARRAARRRRTRCRSGAARRPGSARSPTSRSRSVRSRSPRLREEVGEGELARLERGGGPPPSRRRWCRRRPCPRSGPANSTPDSSNVSRTAAHTSARAIGLVGAEQRRPTPRATARPSRPRGRSRAGRPRRRGRRTSRPANAMSTWRRSRYTSSDPGPAVAPSRSSTTVAASRGSAGVLVPSANARTCSTMCARQPPRGVHRPQTSTSSSTSTGASSGSTGTPDRGAGVLAGLAEDRRRRARRRRWRHRAGR